MIEFSARKKFPAYTFKARQRFGSDLDRLVVLRLVGESRYLLADRSADGKNLYGSLDVPGIRVFHLDSEEDKNELIDRFMSQADVRPVRFASLGLELVPTEA